MENTNYTNNNTNINTNNNTMNNTNSSTNRVTIQDIADALGISRNTVSKAINNTGVLADSTREKVLKKAAEMGYKQFSYLNISENSIEARLPLSKNSGEIALLITGFIGDSHFASVMLDKFQKETSQLGYGFSMHRVLEKDIDALSLPLSFDREKTIGIICCEMFNYPYGQMLCSLGIPVLFVDSPVIGQGSPLKADRLYMDNQTEIFSFVREMADRGKKNIGFIGESMHCQSFYERFMACRNALYMNKLPFMEEYFLLENKAGIKKPSSQDYQDYLCEHLQSLKHLPDVFICANDFIAMDVLTVLHSLGYDVPGDTFLCGFDDSPDSKLIRPALTTIHIHSQIMGITAVQLLLSRIKEPSLNYRTVYTETNLIYRESTGD